MTRRRPGRGFTLLEVVVVLVLLGLTAALAAPAFFGRADPTRDPLRDVIASARRAAVRRAEAVTLDVRADGRWIVTSDAFPDSAPLLSAALPAGARTPFRLRISALGSCLPDESEQALPAWDPLACDVPALPPADGARR